MVKKEFDINKLYTESIKPKVNDLATAYINDCFKNATYDKVALKSYHEQINVRKNQVKKNSKWWAHYPLTIFLGILLLISIIGTVIIFTAFPEYKISIGIALIIVDILLFTLTLTQWISTSILKNRNKALNNEIKDIEHDCKQLLFPIVKHINLSTFTDIIHNAYNDISFSNYIDKHLYDCFFNNWDFQNDNLALCGHITGKVNSHPFILMTTKELNMIPVTYHGTTTVFVDNQTVILTASYTHPKPFYKRNSMLLFYTQGFNELTFNSIGPFTKDKQVRKFYSQNPQYRKMENPEFDLIYPCNRNNEILFRTLFSIYSQELLVKNYHTFDHDFQISKEQEYLISLYRNDQLNGSGFNYNWASIIAPSEEEIKNSFITLTNNIGNILFQYLSLILCCAPILTQNVIDHNDFKFELSFAHIESTLNSTLPLINYLHKNTSKSVLDGIIKTDELSSDKNSIWTKMTVHSHTSRWLTKRIFVTNGKASGYVSVKYEDFNPITKSYLVINFINQNHLKNFNMSDKLKSYNIVGLMHKLHHYAVIFEDDQSNNIPLSYSEIIDLFK